MRLFRSIGKTLSHAATRGIASSHPVEQETDPSLFNYTSGRWLHNEPLRLAERYSPFNVTELKRTVAQSLDRREDEIRSFRKVAEGGFNRSFEIAMNDGLQIVARLPYPSTLPKGYAVASEVATMDLVRSYGVPVPRVYGYSTTPNNAVGSEYIIMEKVGGKEIGHAWYDLSMKEEKSITAEVAKLEAALFSIPLPAFGSVYYKHDLAATDHSIDIPAHEGLCIGPDVALGWWHDRRDTLSIDRGPFVDPNQFTEAGARKELTWIRQCGQPRFPFSRHHREVLGYQTFPEGHTEPLEMYLQISSQLLPKQINPNICHTLLSNQSPRATKTI